VNLALALLTVAWSHPYADEVVHADPPRCDPDSTTGSRWLSVAMAYGEEQRSEDAFGALERAEACGADPAAVLTHRALLSAQLQPPERALPLLDEAISQAPQHLGLLFARARALMALGMAEAAARDWEQALSRVSSPQPDDVLGWSRALAQSGQHPQALEVLDTFIVRLGPSPALVDAALRLELELGWTTAAEARLRGLPDTPFWRARRETLFPCPSP
jgi:tetratricopeptide (TPR) repeat protein